MVLLFVMERSNSAFVITESLSGKMLHPVQYAEITRFCTRLYLANDLPSP